MHKLTRLVIVRVSEKEMKLIKTFAKTNYMNISEAVRSLMAEGFHYMKQGQFGGGGLPPESPAPSLESHDPRTAL